MHLTILHFNDVVSSFRCESRPEGTSVDAEINHAQYHISDSELVAKFASVLADPSLVAHDDRDCAENILRVFSGDAFSPSLEAAVLRGDHMAPLLSSLNLDVACYGNHDFDFGEERLLELNKNISFPWTLANAVAPATVEGQHRLLAGAKEYVVKELSGYKIGLFGLAGTDWPSNCQHLPECTIVNPAEVAQRVARHLRLSEECDLVIAVTHMRLVEDLDVLNSTFTGPEKVDLILGGHNHHVVRRDLANGNSNPEILESGFDHKDDAITESEGDFRIIKSGMDWRGLSIMRLRLDRNDGEATGLSMSLRQIENLKRLPNYTEIPTCQATLDILRMTHNEIQQVVTQPLLHTDVPLDGRMNIIRSRETNLGNMLADAVRAFYDTDIGFVNSGAVRCDRIVECNDGSPLCIRDVIEISPFDNAFVVKRVSGRVLLRALENSVSDAHTDGRFLQLCGLSMTLDWGRQEGSRVSNVLFHPKDKMPQPLMPDHMFTITMVDFIGSGYDGYTCFQECETLVDTEGAITDTNLLLEIFKLGNENHEESRIADHHAEGVQRARAAIILRHHPEEGLPIVGPVVEGRIKVIQEVN